MQSHTLICELSEQDRTQHTLLGKQVARAAFSQSFPALVLLWCEIPRSHWAVGSFGGCWQCPVPVPAASCIPPPTAKWAVPQTALLWGKQEVTIASLLDRMKWLLRSWIKPLISATDHEQTVTDHTPAFRRNELCRISFLQNVPSFHQVWAFTGHCEPENQTWKSNLCCFWKGSDLASFSFVGKEDNKMDPNCKSRSRKWTCSHQKWHLHFLLVTRPSRRWGKGYLEDLTFSWQSIPEKKNPLRDGGNSWVKHLKNLSEVLKTNLEHPAVCNLVTLWQLALSKSSCTKITIPSQTCTEGHLWGTAKLSPMAGLEQLSSGKIM